MDPFTAALIITAVAGAAYSVYSANEESNQKQREQMRAASEQEKARVASIKAEVGLAQQRTNTALVGAQTRKPAAAPSFAAPSQSVMGGLPSLNKPGNTGGSSGTF